METTASDLDGFPSREEIYSTGRRLENTPMSREKESYNSGLESFAPRVEGDVAWKQSRHVAGSTD